MFKKFVGKIKKAYKERLKVKEQEANQNNTKEDDSL